MTREHQIGRTVVAVSFAAIGLEALLTGHLPVGLFPLRTPLPAVLAGLLGTAFAAAVVAAGTTRRVPRAAWIAAALPAIGTLLLHFPRLVTEFKDPLLWSSLLQLLAIIAGALLLGDGTATRIGRWVLAVALVGFGVQHFMYPAFIAGLIPEWLPFRTLLAWATGVGFELAALSFALARYEWLAGRLLAFMFWSWVVILHIPLISAKPELEAGWTSGLIALGLGGVALLMTQAGENELPAALRGRELSLREV